MNESSEALIRELAEKLGTTGEHLWGVLLRQAPISAATEVAMMGALVFALWRTFRMVRGIGPDADYAGVAWITWGGSAVIVAMLVMSSMRSTVQAIFNPEYWALMKLLN